MASYLFSFGIFTIICEFNPPNALIICLEVGYLKGFRTEIETSNTVDVITEMIWMGSTAMRGVSIRTPTLKSVSASRNVREEKVGT